MTSGPLRARPGAGDEDLLVRLLNLEDKADSLVGRIVLDVARDIIVGRLPPAHDLNSLDLSKRFASSRTPVREALLILQKEGLVELQAHRRPRVSELSSQRIVEIYELRAELHALVSRKVAAGLPPEELAVLEQILATMRDAVQAEDLEGYFWGNVLFHEQVAGFARDGTLKRSLDALGLQVLQLRHLSLSLPGRMQLSLQDHQRLLRAYRETDADLAAALGRSIILSARRQLLAALDTHDTQPSPTDARAEHAKEPQ